jgi:benzoyl-CoA reductase/2-hydroxyglutaryl-CoA dehydratase subunit BcrC/BadD/HgdB
MQRTARVHLAMEAKETLARMEEDFGEAPDAMRYFTDLHRRTYCDGQAAPSARKLIGTLCVQVPEELIYAAGAFPVRLCSGAYAYEQVGADFLPARSCPLIKATLGMLHAGMQPVAGDLLLIANPTTCDQKKKAGEMLEDLGYRVHQLEMPSSTRSEEGRLYWQRSVVRFRRALEAATGQKITAQSLAAAIRMVRAAQEAYRRLRSCMRSAAPPIRGSEVMLVTSAYFFDDIANWTAAVGALVREREAMLAAGTAAANRHAPRILFTGSPPVFPQLKLPLLIEQSGGIIVADEVCSASRLLYDMVSYDENHLYDMVPAVADRYLKPCTCPVFTSSEDRARKLLELAEGFSADGVVYQSFAGCMPYELEQRAIGKRLADAGIPLLTVETDYSPDDAGQLTTRVEAFIESLKARSRRRP